MTRVINIHHGDEYDVYIGRGRGSEWGNPFSHLPGTLAQFQVASRAQAIEYYERWLLSRPDVIERARRELTGKVLGCWCAPAGCHGDILVRLCDGEPEGSLFHDV